MSKKGEGGGWGWEEGETDANSKWIGRIFCLHSNLKAVITYFLPKGNVWKRVSGFVRFFWTKNSRTFQGLSRTHFAFFNDHIQCKTRALSLCLFLVLPHQIILSRRSLCLLLFLCSSPWTIKLALKFKDFPVPNAIFKDFQGLEFHLTFKDFQGFSRCVGNPGVWILGV